MLKNYTSKSKDLDRLRNLAIQTCEPCQDRKVAAISRTLYVFRNSWALNK